MSGMPDPPSAPGEKTSLMTPSRRNDGGGNDPASAPATPSPLSRLGSFLRSLPGLPLAVPVFESPATTNVAPNAAQIEAELKRKHAERRQHFNELLSDPERPAYFLQERNRAREMTAGSEDLETELLGEELRQLDTREMWRETSDSESDELDLADELTSRRARSQSKENEGQSPPKTPNPALFMQPGQLTPEQHRALQDSYIVLESAPSLRSAQSAHRFRAFPASQPTPNPLPGRMHIFVLKLELPTLRNPPSTPYVRLRLADQSFDTCVSSRPEGLWNEGFEFRVPLHLQLFGSIVLDVYQGNAIAIDQFVGRCTIRISDLEGLPEVYESWFELWGYVSNPSSAQARGEIPFLSFFPPGGLASLPGIESRSAVARGLGRIGAIRLRICYGWQGIEQQARVPDSPRVEQALAPMSDERARRRSRSQGPGSPRSPTKAVRSASGPLSTLSSQPSDVKSEEDLFFGSDLLYDETEDLPGTGTDFLDRLTETFAGGRENLRLFQAIRALLSSVGQGIEEYVASPSLITGMLLLRRFHASLPPPEPQKERIVRNLGLVEELRWSYRFALAAYGWVGLGFQAGASGAAIRTPSANHHSHLLQKNPDAASIVEFLRIPREDLVENEVRSAAVFAPFHYLCVDRMKETLVLAIRGSLSARDVLTDLASFYTRWNGGLVHHGILRSAQYFYNKILPIAITEMRNRGLQKLRIVGHSLGAGTASLLAMMILDTQEELFPRSDWPDGVDVTCDAFGTPQTASPELCAKPRYMDKIRTVICGWDLFGRASYGSVEDLKTMVVAAVDAVSSSGHLKEMWRFLASGDGDGTDDERAFAALAETRAALGIGQRGVKKRNLKLWPPGTIYFLHKPPAEDRKDAKAGDGVDRRQSGAWLLEKVDGTELEELLLRTSSLVDHFPSSYENAMEKVHYDALRYSGYVSREPVEPPTLENMELKDLNFDAR